RHGPAHAPVQDGGDVQEPEPLVPPRAHHHVGAAARAGPPLAHARRAYRRKRDRLHCGVRLLRARVAAEHGGRRNGAAAARGSSGSKEPHRHSRPRPRRARRRRGAPQGDRRTPAQSRLKAIAERWSLPAATTLRAKGVFPEDHALSLGVFGYAGSRHATAAILGGELDCLLVLGSGFNERDTMHWTVRERSKAFMIHVNTDMEELTAHGD